MRRTHGGGGRSRDRRYIRREVENRGIVNPVNDRPKSEHQQEEDTTTATDRSSGTSPSTSRPYPNLDHPTKPHRNPRSGSRSRRGGGGGGSISKPRSVEKSEVDFAEHDSADCVADELSSLNLRQNSNSVSVNNNNNNKSSGKSITEEEKLHLCSGDHSNCEEPEAKRAENEEITDADETETETETKEDIMLTILNDLRSSVSEPELTDEQLKLNDQLQEDEVNNSYKVYDFVIFQ